MKRKAEHDIARKLKLLNHAKEHGNISKTCRYFGICRETFYTWRRAYESGGNHALINNKPCPENDKLRMTLPSFNGVYSMLNYADFLRCSTSQRFSNCIGLR